MQVIIGFELVGIDHDERQRPSGFHRAVEMLPSALLEIPPVGDASHKIAARGLVMALVGDFLDQRDQPHAGQDGEGEHLDQEYRETRHVYDRGIAGFGIQEGRKGALQRQDRLEAIQGAASRGC